MKNNINHSPKVQSAPQDKVLSGNQSLKIQELFNYRVFANQILLS